MTVYAAGALCWRMFLGEPHVLVVHRPRHKDLSFPKGKIEPGEVLPVTAVREVNEETGLPITLGAKLGVVNYMLPNGVPKEVHYWESHVSEKAVLDAIAAFTPNSEVSELHWLSFPEARRKLSYAHDLEPLDQLEAMLDQDIRHGHTILILRHAKALPRSSWGQSERTRPLASKGVDQAKALISALQPWAPRTLISSTWERCLRTISPYASVSGNALATREKLTEAACAAHPDKTRALIHNHASKGRTVLFCTHRPVLPEVASGIAEVLSNPDSLDIGQIAQLDTGAFSAITVGGPDHRGLFRLQSQEAIHLPN